MSPARDVAAAAAAAQREHWGRVLAGTLRLAHDLDLAEEATADAFALALETWPLRGVPDSVEAWLLTTARRRAIDRIRRATRLRDKLGSLGSLGSLVDEPIDGVVDRPPVVDDELRLVVLCCHPALAVAGQVALTLRLACGAPTAAVASGFLVSDATMAARLTRAKRRIAGSGIGIELPDDRTVDDRLPAVRRAVHLAYTMGHTAGSGAALRDDELAGRARRLASSLHRLRPNDRESAGLLAVVLLSEARAGTRLAADGSQVLLADADRGGWDADLAAEGLALGAWAMAAPPMGPFALQAAIAAEHAIAADVDSTDWPRVVGLYDQLLTLEPSPTVALGRCVAMSYWHGPEVGLADVEGVMAVGGLDGYPYAHAVRARLHERLGHAPEARRAWIRAADCSRTDAEHHYFLEQCHAP